MRQKVDYSEPEDLQCMRRSLRCIAHGVAEGCGAKSRGNALVVVLIVVTVLSLVGQGLMKLSTANAVEAGKTVSKNHAFRAAEGGWEASLAKAGKDRKPLEETDVYGSDAVE